MKHSFFDIFTVNVSDDARTGTVQDREFVRWQESRMDSMRKMVRTAEQDCGIRSLLSGLK